MTQSLLTTAEELNALKLEHVPDDVRQPPVAGEVPDAPAVLGALRALLQGTGVSVDEVVEVAPIIVLSAMMSLTAQGASEETMRVADTVGTTMWLDGLVTGLRHAQANA